MSGEKKSGDSVPPREASGAVNIPGSQALSTERGLPPSTRAAAPGGRGRGVRREIDVAQLARAVRGSERAGLARAITLVESTRADHREAAQRLLLELTADSGAGESNRVGITGVPGVGKSTFIDALGMYLIGQGHRVAVLAVDPSSTRTGGSILGDKTRMARLAVERNAYIRPSPTAGTLGGVAKATRETIVLLEAAGYDVILVETVGVGQSEVTVANMVDVFCFLTLARTGDQLQGIKKGVLELADLVAVNKADGHHELEAKAAARELQGAMRLIHPRDSLWRPPVLTMSGLNGIGLDTFWDTILHHRRVLTEAGEFTEKRRRQQVDWTWTMVHDQLLRRLADNPQVKTVRGQVEKQVRDGSLTPALAAEEILRAFDGR
ncbi:methylmalonyl Co-A mutase-associated GTPase MeaB [Nocardia terpenica]|uniref:methylmalonyl Co-A mutase-associated GTPase MeaB n=1 Tax=Nocardia terpenica TaxID=455432 RepID=UPI00189379AD|nr:methylmalonyl Co-A mutase-associated GTPase MeaB [Nocardia terpenica]MBF6059462.1 methylmalonyl Co-A mutase-associated GTPase MeaB [Nocardia terpenica]MBF6102999.1 methylmalonyl Co-A mutase-associated GTPase MeaB [Nocardia terpenica]MBF6110812.1 methylmalonyl Co-A mutase-associated GTPase MeaB [Nocardia terpenica]MBF6116943.1 methylmalonyl Co-A mutase-associated GTPase MeaB [Nocardia terpenica]MBF6151219.1 methylmalonyl Co-A mutase-associated GTPase MeaB [Nocardia terpenica]